MWVKNWNKTNVISFLVNGYKEAVLFEVFFFKYVSSRNTIKAI